MDSPGRLPRHDRGHVPGRIACLRRRRREGNLCGYVEDILRGRPAFAVAANLPRRSGTTQLNHLVASLFAQGLSLDPTYLYAQTEATARRSQQEAIKPTGVHRRRNRAARQET